MDSNQSLDSFIDLPFSSSSTKKEDSIVNVGESDSQASQEAQSYSEHKHNYVSALKGFPRREDLRTKNYILYFKMEVVQILLSKFKEAATQILSTILASAEDNTKYTEQPCKKLLSPSERQRALAIIQHSDYWILRFKQLKPIMNSSHHRFSHWEQLLVHYFLLLRDWIKVRYILKKMGQGWQTIFVFQKGRDFEVEVPAASATEFQKQEFSMSLVSRLVYQASDLPSTNHIQDISRYKHFQLYKEKMLRIVPKVKQFEEDSPKNKREYYQIMKQRARKNVEIPREIYNICSGPALSRSSSLERASDGLEPAHEIQPQKEENNVAQLVKRLEPNEAVVTIECPPDHSIMNQNEKVMQLIQKKHERMKAKSEEQLVRKYRLERYRPEEEKRVLRSTRPEILNKGRLPKKPQEVTQDSTNEGGERKGEEKKDDGEVVYSCNVQISNRKERQILKAVQETAFNIYEELSKEGEVGVLLQMTMKRKN